MQNRLPSNSAALTDASQGSDVIPLTVNRDLKIKNVLTSFDSTISEHDVPTHALNPFFLSLLRKCPMDDMHFFEHVENVKVCSW